VCVCVVSAFLSVCLCVCVVNIYKCASYVY